MTITSNPSSDFTRVPYERADKTIGSSLQARPKVHIAWDYESLMVGVDMAEVSITSAIDLVAGEGPAAAFRLEEVAGVAVEPGLAEGDKCERCWRVLPEVGENAAAPGTCRRCAGVVSALEAVGRGESRR